MKEISDILESWSDDENPVQSVNIIPPDVDEQSDEEFIDENFIVINSDPSALCEVAGYVEIETQRNSHEDIGYEEFKENESDTGPSTSNLSSKSTVRLPKENPSESYKSLRSFGTPKWSRNEGNKHLLYDISPNASPLTDTQKHLCEKVKDLSPIQLFSKFYDEEVLNHIITETNRFAAQKNSNFKLNAILLKRFLGILLLSGYHTLPSVEDYWSTKPSMGIPIVKQALTRFMFSQIKKSILPIIMI